MYTKNSVVLHDVFFTVGKIYDIIEIHNDRYVILDDSNKRVSFHPNSNFGRSLTLYEDKPETQNYEEWIEE